MYPKLALINALLFSTLLTLQNTAGAAQCTAKTGAQANALLELYTSEGCSSCPPADAWLSKLTKNGVELVLESHLHMADAQNTRCQLITRTLERCLSPWHDLR